MCFSPRNVHRSTFRENFQNYLYNFHTNKYLIIRARHTDSFLNLYLNPYCPIQSIHEQDSDFIAKCPTLQIM